MNLAGKLILRYSWALLFFWFGYAQLTDASAWVFFLPEWTGYFPIPGEMLIQLNGLMEICGAILLAAGVFTRLVSAFLAVHLGIIALSVGGAIGARDATLSAVGFALALMDPDPWTLDERQKQKKTS